MTKTGHYQLNQWDPEDKVQRTDFNADNAKIDAALAAKADASDLTAYARAVCGTYVGTGTYGKTNPCVLDFADTLGRAPLLLIIRPVLTETMALVMVNGLKSTMYNLGNTSSGSGTSEITWGKTSVSWYAGVDHAQMNSVNTTYCYVAIA